MKRYPRLNRSRTSCSVFVRITTHKPKLSVHSSTTGFAAWKLLINAVLLGDDSRCSSSLPDLFFPHQAKSLSPLYLIPLIAPSPPLSLQSHSRCSMDGPHTTFECECMIATDEAASALLTDSLSPALYFEDLILHHHEEIEAAEDLLKAAENEYCPLRALSPTVYYDNSQAYESDEESDLIRLAEDEPDDSLLLTPLSLTLYYEAMASEGGNIPVSLSIPCSAFHLINTICRQWYRLMRRSLDVSQQLMMARYWLVRGRTTGRLHLQIRPLSTAVKSFPINFGNSLVA